MTQTITQDSAEFATFPKTIRELIAETVQRGGEAIQDAPRIVSFYLPRRMVGGTIRQRQAGTVGWHVRDGRNRIGATVHDVREALDRGYC